MLEVGFSGFDVSAFSICCFSVLTGALDDDPKTNIFGCEDESPIVFGFGISVLDLLPSRDARGLCKGISLDCMGLWGYAGEAETMGRIQLICDEIRGLRTLVAQNVMFWIISRRTAMHHVALKVSKL
ncbi:hypothetical protein TMatcc_007981 [Talaromyces marneffei ATCC 18224]